MVKEWGSLRIQQELIVGFDPVKIFVELLEQRLGHLGMFFYDKYGGDIIAIKWHSKVQAPVPSLQLDFATLCCVLTLY